MILDNKILNLYKKISNKYVNKIFLLKIQSAFQKGYNRIKHDILQYFKG